MVCRVGGRQHQPLDGTEEYVKADIGFYIQGSSRFSSSRSTPASGMSSSTPWSRSSGDRKAVRAGQIFREVTGEPGSQDWAPRFGVAYDLFGDGETALKFGANRYMRPMAGSFVRRSRPAPGLATDTRDWFDVDLVPDTGTRGYPATDGS